MTTEAKTDLSPSDHPGLNETEWRAAELLHSGEHNLTAVHKAVGKGKTWLWETRQKPEFQDALRRMEQETFDQGMQILKANAVRVTKALLQCATEGKKSSRVTALKECMARLYGNQPQTEVAVLQAQTQDLTQLPADLKRQVLEALGGPTDMIDAEPADDTSVTTED